MRRCAWILLLLLSANLNAAKINMRDDRRAVGTDDGIRIDAQLAEDSVSPHFPIGVTYQVENLTKRPIAIADKSCDTSWDPESATITLDLGMEIPKDGLMPRLAVIAPGAKRTFIGGATFSGPVVPRFVQIRVNVLRDPDAFREVTERQHLTDAQFDRWIDANEPIDLNVLPVRYRPAMLARTTDASQR